jgi:hypothetical protein
MRVPNPICAGFFILRTYALWNHNRIVLAAMLFFLLVSSMTCSLHALDFMHESGCYYINCQHNLCRYCDRTMYAFSSYPLRPTIAHTPRSQLRPAQYRVSQAAIRPRKSSFSYRIFSCLRSNLVCLRPSVIYRRSRADPRFPQDFLS